MALSYSDRLAQLIKLQDLNFTQTTAGLRDFLATVSIASSTTGCMTSDLSSSEMKIVHALRDYEKLVNDLKETLYKELDSKKQEFAEISKQIWVDNIANMTFEENFEWAPCWPPTGEEYDYLFSVAATHASWEYPGLVYGAKHRREMIEAITGSDPIYIVENHREYFDYHKTLFPVDMGKKFRCYHLSETHMLPKNGIGQVFVYNEFPFLPWQIIRDVIKIFSETLMPGGTFIFNFNDCTTVKGMKAFEDKLMTYSTPAMFETLFNSLNMRCTKIYRSNSENFTLMTFVKEGEKPNIKANPSLGYVKMQDPKMFALEEKRRRIEFIRKAVSE